MNINLYTTQWAKTGNNVNVPQYSLNVRVIWTGNDGVTHEGERTALFPNVLANLPIDYLKEKMTEMLVNYALQELEARE